MLFSGPIRWRVPMLHIKILGIRSNERYIVRRLVAAAQRELQSEFPGLSTHITEISDAAEIGKVAGNLILPSLIIDRSLVCQGRIPSGEEVVAWLRQAALTIR